jgi:hypothetical protein
MYKLFVCIVLLFMVCELDYIGKSLDRIADTVAPVKTTDTTTSDAVVSDTTDEKQGACKPTFIIDSSGIHLP